MTQISLRSELYRKVVHFLLLAVPITYLQLGKWQSLIIFASIACVIVPLDYMRRSNPMIQKFFVKIFGIILRSHELSGNKLCGASSACLAACITFFFFKAEIAVTAFIILVVSDAFAAIIGRNFPSNPFFEKSISGASAFFVTGLMVLIGCGMYFDVKFWFYLFGVFALFCVTILESRPDLTKIDDNFTIPIGFSVIMTIFDIMWNYTY